MHTESDVKLLFLHFSQKLMIVAIRFFGEFLCTRNKDSRPVQFMRF